MYNLHTSNFNYKLFAQVVLALSYFFETYLKMRQFQKQRNSEIPQKIKDIKEINITQKEYEQIKQYSSEKTALSVMESTVDFFLVVFLIQYDFFSFVWNNTYQYTSSILISLIVLILAESLVSLVHSTIFSYYKTFYLEESYGYNKTDRKTFVTDIVKSLLLSIVFSGIFLYLISMIMDYFEEKFIMYAMIFTIIFTITLLVLYPSFIAPLFNKFENLDKSIEKEKLLQEKIENLCKELNFPLTNLYKMDGSKRSSHSQAYFFGILHKKKIVVYDTLIEKLETDEIVAVVCHELGHWYYYHNIQMLVMQFANIGLLFFLFSLFFQNDKFYYDFGFETKFYIMGFYVFMKLLEPVNILFMALFCALSRKNEFQADQFALKKKRGNELIMGLIRLFKDSKGDMDPDHIYSKFKHTHPNLVQRVQAIRNLQKKDK